MPPAEPVTTVSAALADGRARLTAAGSPTPRLDAEVLLAHVIRRDRSWLLAHPEAPVDDADAWTDALARRAAGEPVAYIRGFKEWRSLRIRTDPRALIPRPETELLADTAVDEIRARLMASAGAPVVAWEVATGSGAVAVALALELRPDVEAGRLRLVASDLSPEALALARENLRLHRVDELVELHEADLLAPAGDALPLPDVVVANLPYVPTEEAMAPERGLGHEPRMAIDGGPDGLAVFRRLFAVVPDRVAAGATLLLEIGAGQGQDVAALVPAPASARVLPDLAGIGRVVRIGMADSTV